MGFNRNKISCICLDFWEKEENANPHSGESRNQGLFQASCDESGFRLSPE